MKKKRKKAMEDPRFAAWFQSEYNPGIDPWELGSDDRVIRLNHIYENGIFQRVTVHALRGKNKWAPQQSSPWMVTDYKGFMEWYRSDLNPEADISRVRLTDCWPLLNYEDENGILQVISPLELFTQKNWYVNCANVNRMAMHDPRFVAWFQPEFNPGIDPWTVKKWDKCLHLTHVYENGVIQRITVYSLFCHNQWRAEHSFPCMLEDCIQFRDWYQPEHNPGVDISKIRIVDKTPLLKHVEEDGTVYEISPLELVSAGNWYIQKKKRAYKYAMEDPRFAAWYQPEYNPGIDPWTLLKNDRLTRLNHVYDNGIIQRITPYYIISMKKWNPTKSSCYKAMEYQEFRLWYQKEENPEVDPWTLRIIDKEPLLRHVEPDGTVQMISVLELFTRGNWYIDRKQCSKPDLAMEYWEFQEWFQPEYNPDVDPWTIHIRDKEPILVHRHENGAVQRISPFCLFIGNKWKLVKSHGSMAGDYPIFMFWFQREMNPGVDPYKLSKSDETTILYHVYENGKIQRTTARKLFMDNLWELKHFHRQLAADDPRFRRWFQPDHNPHVDLATLKRWDSKTKVYHAFPNGYVRAITPYSLFQSGLFDERLQMMAMDYPDFRAWYQPEYNPGLDPWTLKVSDRETSLAHEEEDGSSSCTTVRDLFESRGWEMFDENTFFRGTGWMIDATVMDKEIELFLPDKEQANKLKRCYKNSLFQFTCPLCGSEFEKNVGRMINTHPKCPICSDTGFMRQNEEPGAEGYYMTVQ